MMFKPTMTLGYLGKFINKGLRENRSLAFCSSTPIAFLIVYDCIVKAF